MEKNGKRRIIFNSALQSTGTHALQRFVIEKTNRQQCYYKGARTIGQETVCQGVPFSAQHPERNFWVGMGSVPGV